ncbi:MAG: glycosyltransferase family 4 protein [Acuticoccus sp.]
MPDPSRPLVVYAGPFAFPQGGAAARRILGNALSLIAAGFLVEVWTGAKTAPGASDLPQGLTVRTLGERNAEGWPRLLKHLAYSLIGRGLVRALRAEARPLAAVVLYGGYTPYLWRLLAWSRRSGTPVAFDAVEWYDPPHRLRWLVDPYYWNTEFAMRRLAPRLNNAITISRHLEAHFVRSGCHTLRLPPTLDVAAVPADVALRPADAPLVLSYTGSPGHKDRLGALLAAFARLGAAGAPLRLDIAGIGEAELLALADVRAHGVRTLPANVVLHGNLSHAGALGLTRRADFSVLLRPPQRYAQAGFPTKVAESLACGTPVFGNLTGDLGHHLRDGETAILVPAIDTESVLAGLRRLLALPRGALTPMRAAARAEAEAAFDYRSAVPALAGFVANLATCRG